MPWHAAATKAGPARPVNDRYNASTWWTNVLKSLDVERVFD
jgi:hypothetical protein